MHALPPALERLVSELSKLPGVGGKTARRLSFHLLSGERDKMDNLAKAIAAARERIVNCRRCRGFSETEICSLCADPRRDASSICVVEKASDVLPFEQAGVFKGLYFVLGGVISPLDGVSPEKLHITELVERIKTEGVKEVILALGSSPEAESTAIYIDKRLADANCRRTKLARGIPVGSDLEFIDEITMLRAFEERVGV